MERLNPKGNRGKAAEDKELSKGQLAFEAWAEDKKCCDLVGK